jgi:threonine dehydrogenase-like Zn-dependent dehydrogenase
MISQPEIVLAEHCDGGMRPEFNLPIHKLHRSASASLDQLALVEMLCIGQHAVNRSLVAKEDLVLVLGAGPIGLSVISFLKGRGKRLVVADLSETRLAFCREAMESGAVDTSPWITHRIAFDDVPERFGIVIADPTLRKAVIEV